MKIAVAIRQHNPSKKPKNNDKQRLLVNSTWYLSNVPNIFVLLVKYLINDSKIEKKHIDA